MKKTFKIGDTIIMPEPNDTDIWQYGNFSARIVDERNGNFVVEDQDSDFFEIEKNRVLPDED